MLKIQLFSSKVKIISSKLLELFIIKLNDGYAFKTVYYFAEDPCLFLAHTQFEVKLSISPATGLMYPIHEHNPTEISMFKHS